MRNLEAARKVIKNCQLSIGFDLGDPSPSFRVLKAMDEAFQAYHNIKTDPPEFKPGDWVMLTMEAENVGPGPHQLELQWHGAIGGSVSSWMFKGINEAGWWMERNFRLATDAEKFRPGAVVTCKGTIRRISTHKNGKIRGLFLEEFGIEMKSKCCTLITAVPVKEKQND